MKKLLALLLVSLFLFTLVPFYSANAQEETDVKYGLTVSDDGTILLAGKPFYAFGENNYGTYARWVEDYNKDWFRESIPLFKEYNIPFIRCSFSGYAPSYYQDFDKNPDKYLEMMDEVIKCAEENQLGLIVSLMWNQIALPSAFGEKMSAMGDPNSKTVAFAKEYVATIVERYKDSPAIWGWEIGNEYNLSADLCDPNLKEWAPQHYVVGEVTGHDYVTSAEVTFFYEEVAKVIREIDDYRLISNGNGEMRSFAYASYVSSTYFMNEENHTWSVSWSQNSRDEFYEMCDYFTPDPIDTLSFHFQHATLGSSDPHYIMDFKLFYEGTLSLTEYLKAYAQAARRLGKAAYFGEFGDMLDMDTAPDRAEKFQYVMDCIRDAGIQIASAWHYQDVTTEGFHGENLEMIGEMNREYQERGVQDLDAYWSNVADTDMPSDWALTETYAAAAVGLVPAHINGSYTTDITRSDFCDLIIKMIEKKSGKAIADVIA
ncbi:MAG: glycoside hydrolase family 5 protein, partial [Ruminococcaceae bacterium]|nr:glycoside hydrolase family 5 protein [Oscillospiraceae bacterium]